MNATRTIYATAEDWNRAGGEQEDQYSIRATDTGPYCGNCRTGTRHANTSAIRLCYELAAQADADQAADIAAELAVERALEDRGYWEAQAQDDYERSRGVIPFDVAYAAALAAVAS